ncbi:MAG: 5'-nucleotidase C-terminal domain-containing protein [Lachnospiraceae bacterium]|nr:5'-nucleotidase C-terminal domain-containing protein [Lachnospiraceae bacterium]
MKHYRKWTAILAALLLMLTAACGQGSSGSSSGQTKDPGEQTTASATEEKTTAEAESASEVSTPEEKTSEEKASDDSPSGKDGSSSETEGTFSQEETSDKADEPEKEPEKNGQVMILYTSDVHCGIDQGFGYAGLYQIRETMEKQGYTTILVDNGDSIQGESIGSLSKGETIIDLMNAMKYDVAIPGNHEFTYGTDRFLELAEMADFPYICCNFRKEGELIFDPYIIKEAAGMKIAFVGVTTPKTITSATPAFFQDENGTFIYDFMQDETGEQVYRAVQDAVDAARKEGADYVYVLGHVGMGLAFSPWNYADIIEHTSGIDVFLDGHSHDTEQVIMKNKDGEDVVRSACGTKLNGIGYSIISPEGVSDTGLWTWDNVDSAPDLLGIRNEMKDRVDAAQEALAETLEKVVAHTSVKLTINDPVEVDSAGKPIRMIRRAETNMGDLCADALLDQTGADIAIMNGGAIRTDIEKGDITYGDIINVLPFGNTLCLSEVTGQMILDALEWGARVVPEQFGGFQQVAGLSYEIDLSVESPCLADENNMCAGFEGERRVKNVRVGGEMLDPEKTYKLGASAYTVLQNGDGITAFDDAVILREDIKVDNQALIDYIVDTLGGEISGKYADPYGEGRIVILDN